MHADFGLIDHRDPHTLWKYWINTRTGEERAFNLSSDPQEDHNVITQIGPAQRGEWRLHAQAGSAMALAHN